MGARSEGNALLLDEEVVAHILRHCWPHLRARVVAVHTPWRPGNACIGRGSGDQVPHRSVYHHGAGFLVYWCPGYWVFLPDVVAVVSGQPIPSGYEALAEMW